MKLSYIKSFALAGAMLVYGAATVSADALPEILASDISGSPVLTGVDAQPAVTKNDQGFVRFLGMPDGQVLKIQGSGTAKTTANTDQVEAFMQSKGKAFYTPSDRVVFKNGKTQSSISGFNYTRLVQFYGGLPVFDAQAVFGLTPSGDINMVNSDIMRTYGKLESLNLAPKVDSKAAIAAACYAGSQKFGASHVFEQNTDPKLGIYSPEVYKKSGEPQLAWRVEVFSVFPSAQLYRFFINSEDGSVLDGYSLLTKLTPIDRWVYDQDNEVWPVDVPEKIELLAADNPPPALFPPGLPSPKDEDYCTIKCLQEGKDIIKCLAACKDVRNVFNFMGMGYNYFAESFNHEVSPYIDPLNQKQPGFLNGYCRFRDSEDFDTMLNAFFASYPGLAYPGRPYTAGFYFGEGITADDAVVHEMGHAVTGNVIEDAYGNSVGFVYQNDSGALSEFYSDLFGESCDLVHRIQFYPTYDERMLNRTKLLFTHDEYKITDVIQFVARHYYRDQDDTSGTWLIGEDLSNRDLSGRQTFSTVDPPTVDDPPAHDPHPILSGGRALRNMANPPEFFLPDRKNSPLYYTGTGDNGGVHTNCGVGSKLYYLLTQGDTFRSKTIKSMGLRGIQSREDKFKPTFSFVIDPITNPYEYRSRVDSSKLFWEALMMLTPTSTYDDLTRVLIQAGKNYQLSTDEMLNLRNALWAVDLVVTEETADTWDTKDDWPITTQFPENATEILMSPNLQVQSHLIGSADLSDSFRMALKVGYTYRFSNVTQSIRQRATLYDEFLKPVARVETQEGETLLLDYYATHEGTYFLCIEPLDDVDTPQPYTFGWRILYSTAGDAWDPTDNTRDQATQLPIPTETIATHGEHMLDNTVNTKAYDYEDWFKMTLFSGITYEFKATGGFGATIAELYDSQKNMVAGDIYGSNGQGRFLLRFKPVANDTYYLRVKANGNIKVRYILEYSQAAKLTVGDTWDPYDDTVDGATILAEPVKYALLHGEHTLGYNVDFADWYVVRLTAGRTYIFDTKSGTSFGSAMASLYDGKKRLLSQDSNSGSDNQFRIVYTPKSTGDFYLCIKPTVFAPGAAGMCRHTLQYRYK